MGWSRHARDVQPAAGKGGAEHRSSAAVDRPDGCPYSVDDDLSSHALSLRAISKVYAVGDTSAVHALQNVFVDVEPGEFVSVIGPSGSGKTTLLRVAAGLTPRTGGNIYIHGKPVSGVSRDTAFVFQDISLLPWRTVLENVAIGLEARRMSRAARRARAMDALTLVGLAEAADRPPYTLSGGMQQRVGVARALAVQPEILYMDEPFGQLDNFTRERLQTETARLWERLGIAVVFVTHDVDEAILLSDRIVLMQGPPGHVTEVLPVDLPRPRWDYNIRACDPAIQLREHIVTALTGGPEES